MRGEARKRKEEYVDTLDFYIVGLAILDVVLMGPGEYCVLRM